MVPAELPIEVGVVFKASSRVKVPKALENPLTLPLRAVGIATVSAPLSAAGEASDPTSTTFKPRLLETTPWKFALELIATPKLSVPLPLEAPVAEPQPSIP